MSAIQRFFESLHDRIDTTSATGKRVFHIVVTNSTARDVRFLSNAAIISVDVLTGCR
jgi:hypothetical protein